MRNYIRDIIEQYARHDYPPALRREVGRWLAHKASAAEKDEALRALWEEARAQGMPRGMSTSIRTMRRHTGMEHGEQAGSNRRVLRLWQVAAVVLLALSSVSAYLLLTTRTEAADVLEAYIPRTEMREITLPDGTQVQLNSESTLLYPQRFDGKTRSVYLVGQANFRVKHDPRHPFVVKANDFQVTALGTEFQVAAYPDEAQVAATLLSGSVRVEYNELQSQIILRPSEQLVYHKQTKTHRLHRPDIADETAWQRGGMVFNSLDIEDILTRLERKYPYTFVYSPNSMKQDTYTFRFQPGATLDEVMTVITHVAGIHYKVVGDKCYLMPK